NPVEERAARRVQRRTRAEVHRKRLARQGGFTLRGLDSITRERVQVWSVALAGWEEIDSAEDGELFVRGVNAVTRALAAVEARLRDVGLDAAGSGRGAGALDRHIRERYGGDNGGGACGAAAARWWY